MTQNQQERLHKIFEDLKELHFKIKEATPEEKVLLQKGQEKLQKEKDELEQELLAEERFLGIDFGEIALGTCTICDDYIWDNEVDRDEAFFEGADPRPPHHNRCLGSFMKTGKLLPHHMAYYQNPEEYFANEYGIDEDGVSYYEKMGYQRGVLYQQAVAEGWSHLLPPIQRMSWDEVVTFLTERALERGFLSQEIAAPALPTEEAVASGTISDILSGKVSVPVFACRYFFRPEILFTGTSTKENKPDILESEHEKSVVREAHEKQQQRVYVAFVPSKYPPDPEKKTIRREDLCDMGVLGELAVVPMEQGEHLATIKTLDRVRIAWQGDNATSLIARLTHLPEVNDLDFSVPETNEKIENILMVVKTFQTEVFHPEVVNLWMSHQAIIKAGKFGSILDSFAFYCGLGSALEEDLFPYRYAVLEAASLSDRLEKTTQLASYFYNRMHKARSVFQNQEKDQASAQHKAMLRGQITALQKELGEENEEVLEWEARLKEFEALTPPLPPLAIKEAKKVLRAIKRYKPEDSPYAKNAEWLNNFFALSWNTSTKDNFDLANVKTVLEADHYGITHINKRIVGYAALLKQHEEYRELVVAGKAELQEEHKRREVLCFLGPPGVAKTSLGRSIARALGRKFYATSFGGVDDAEEIHGFLETFVGSMPGIIIRGIIAAGSNNPVFMIDEIDKTSRHRGNPQAAFLALLDSTLTDGFTDKYMRVPFDISRVLFILTANSLENVLPALVDRMEVIEFSGYTARQKLEIAKRHLVPKAIAYHHTNTVFPDETLEAIRDRWTQKEAGVRNFERKIFAVCRETLVTPPDGPVRTDMLPDLLGPEVVPEMPRMSAPEVGVVAGLAYTEVGGAVMVVEVELHVSDKKFTRLEDQVFATGSVMDVMKESMLVALARVRKLAADQENEYGITMKVFEKSRFHVHVAPLATKKDGPSATVTLFVAFVSALSGLPVDHTVAMTGELMLRGKTLPVGGLPQKFSAAHREGIRKIIYPSSLQGTVAHLQQENPELQDIEFIPVDTDREALQYTLVLNARNKDI